MAQDRFPSILMIMICIDCGLGGAEKRYARLFKKLLCQSDVQHNLLINRSMFELFRTAGILSENERPYIIVLDSPFGRFAQSMRTKHWVFGFLEPILHLLNVFWYAWQCWQVIHRFKPDVVHPLLTSMYLSLPALLLHPKTGHIMSAYATDFSPDDHSHSGLGLRIAYAIKLYAMRRSQAIDALKFSIRDNLTALGVDDDRIYVAPCSFTDLTLCELTPDKKRWVVYLGRFINHKNPLLLARAIPVILSQVPDAHFFFLGKGYLQPQLEELVRELDVADQVTIRFELNPTHILSQSTIFASMQTLDNYPSQSLLEAMACGNAVVATNVGETWRLVDDTNGYLVPLTVDAVAEAIIKLFKDPLLHERGLASRQRILSEYTLERFFEYITKVYQAAGAVEHK